MSDPKCYAAAALLTGTVGELRDVWEGTSFAIERLQAAEACVDEEQAGLASRVAPSWHLSFTPTPTPLQKLAAADKVSVHYRSHILPVNGRGVVQKPQFCCFAWRQQSAVLIAGACSYHPRGGQQR